MQRFRIQNPNVCRDLGPELAAAGNGLQGNFIHGPAVLLMAMQFAGLAIAPGPPLVPVALPVQPAIQGNDGNQPIFAVNQQVVGGNGNIQGGNQPVMIGIQPIQGVANPPVPAHGANQPNPPGDQPVQGAANPPVPPVPGANQPTPSGDQPIQDGIVSEQEDLAIEGRVSEIEQEARAIETEDPGNEGEEPEIEAELPEMEGEQEIQKEEPLIEQQPPNEVQPLVEPEPTEPDDTEEEEFGPVDLLYLQGVGVRPRNLPAAMGREVVPVIQAVDLANAGERLAPRPIRKKLVSSYKEQVFVFLLS